MEKLTWGVGVWGKKGGWPFLKSSHSFSLSPSHTLKKKQNRQKIGASRNVIKGLDSGSALVMLYTKKERERENYILSVKAQTGWVGTTYSVFSYNWEHNSLNKHSRNKKARSVSCWDWRLSVLYLYMSRNMKAWTHQHFKLNEFQWCLSEDLPELHRVTLSHCLSFW